MDKNLAWFNEEKISRTIKALKKNNIAGFLVENKEELINKIDELTSEGDKVTCGGSMTLFETGVIDHLRSGRFDFKDRYKENLSQEDIIKIYKEAFTSDVYFASANAITEDGYIYNVDGNGNRVAAILYGPDKVILICGVNKIVKNTEEAINRNREISGPINAKRLNRNTPCVRVGYCMNCDSQERICREYTLIKSQGREGRISVIFLNESLGY